MGDMYQLLKETNVCTMIKCICLRYCNMLNSTISQQYYHINLSYDNVFVKCNLHPKNVSQFRYWKSYELLAIYIVVNICCHHLLIVLLRKNNYGCMMQSSFQ